MPPASNNLPIVLLVDGMLVLALQDVAEHRAGVAVQRTGLARFERHFHRRHLAFIPVERLGHAKVGALVACRKVR